MLRNIIWLFSVVLARVFQKGAPYRNYFISVDLTFDPIVQNLSFKVRFARQS